MDDPDKEWTNELLETEEELIAEMREAYRKRLAERLQKKLEAKEKRLPEIRRLKKKGPSGCS